MTKTDVLAWIDSQTALFSERTTGNELNAAVAQHIRPLIESDRTAVIDALRELIGLRVPEAARRPQDAVRKARLWLALEVAASNRLIELREDLRAVIVDVRSKRSFLPYYEQMLTKYDERLAGSRNRT